MKQLRQEIAKGAFGLWISKGRRHDTQLQDWLEAEADLKRRSRPDTQPAFPVFGVNGVPSTIRGIATDVTEHRQARRQLNAEHEVTRALSESATLGDAAPRILEAACESLGCPAGLFWGVDQAAGVLRCVEIWHAAAAGDPAFDQLNRQATISRGAGLPGRIWASGRPECVADVAADAGPSGAAAAGAGELRGACGFPVRNGEEILGVIEFFSRVIREPDASVLDMMASIGSQIGQFAARRRAEKALHERATELSLARAIQQRRLPAAAPVLTGFTLFGASLPAQETGGDYLDYIPMPGGSLGLAVGDASGHGIAAALLMAETRAYLRAQAHTDTDVGNVLTRVNRHVAEDAGEDFVTLLLVRLDPGRRTLAYSSAGHQPGYLLDARGEVKAVLGSTAPPLGLDPSTAIPGAAALTMEAGELLLMMTDGVVEAFSPESGLFGRARALAAVRARRAEPPRQIVEALLAEVRAFTQGAQTDDMTAVVLKG